MSLSRPRVTGVQTALVTGPKGEEIYTDRFGRIKVQFHWDREGQRDENSSCWLRVSQAWAGNQWGALMLPRIGQEVIVSFLNGDPDRPLVTGALYNGTHQAPYTLPANKTRTTLKSQSSPGGGGYNELRMDDKKGSEQLFVHGQKDVDLYVKNDRMESIDHDRHRIVAAAAFEKIGNDHSRKITANHNLKVAKTLSQAVGGNVNQKTGQNWLEKAGVDYSLKAVTSVVLDAGMSITLKGGGTIALDPSGVSITGSQVRINSGGSAGSAKGASPTAPQPPKPLDPGTPGSAVNTLGADARFKQQPVAFDQSKAKDIDESALKALETTYKHGKGTPKNSNSKMASAAAASTGAAALAASLARVQNANGAMATKVYNPERIEQLLSGRGLGGQMSRHNGVRTEAAALKEMDVTAQDTVVDVSGLEREQKLDAVFNETGYYLSDDTADAVVAAVDGGDNLLVITDAVNEGTANAQAFIASQPEVKAYRENLEAAIQDPEGSAYGGGPGYIGGLAEGERLVSNILTVNGDKMLAGLKDASAQDLMMDAAGLALSGAPAVGMMRGVGKVQNKTSKDYGVAFFGEDNLGYYTREGATIGRDGKSFFFMPLDDSAAVRNAADAARYTGRAPSAEAAYLRGGDTIGQSDDIFGLSFPTNGKTVTRPTAQDAGGWPHYLEGGNTAIKTGDGSTTGYLVNPTREFVTPGGGLVPDGSVLFKLGPNGEWLPIKDF